MKLNYDVDAETLDITKPEHGVQVELRNDQKVLWINIDGRCVVRICQIPLIEFNLPKDWRAE